MLGIHRINVSTRLGSLVAMSTLVSALLLALALGLLADIQSDRAYRKKLVLEPMEGLITASDGAAVLRQLSDGPGVADSREGAEDFARGLAEMARFRAQYDRDWRIVDQASDDAERFRDAIPPAALAPLLEQERDGLRAIDDALLGLRPSATLTPDERRLQVMALRGGVRALLAANTSQGLAFNDARSARNGARATALLAIGAGSIVLSLLLGAWTYRAIAPRIQSLVKMVRRFQDLNVFERTSNETTDEIGVLTAALNTGLASLAARDRERQDFLAIVAHELKTPLTTILGYAQATLANPEAVATRERAVEVIGRQAKRLGHLIDELMLTTSLRERKAAFRPQPCDLSAMTRDVIEDLSTTSPGHTVALEAPSQAQVLVDPTLVGQALWSFFNYGLAALPHGEGLHGRLSRGPNVWRIDLDIDAPILSAEDARRCFSPFEVLQYEDHGAARATSGLYFTREVARLHGGRVELEQSAEKHLLLRLELPG